MADDDDAMSGNFFDVSGAPVRRLPEEPPPARSEDDYGENVIPIKGRPKKDRGWKEEWQMSENGSPLPNLFNVLIALRWHPKLTSVVRLDEIECAIFIEKAVTDE